LPANFAIQVALQSVEVEVLADEDVVAADGLEGISGEDEVEGMPGLGGKVDVEAPKDAVEGGDAAEAPALVLAEASLDELEDGVDVAGLDLAAGDQLIEFVFHLLKLARPARWRARGKKHLPT
jgi:hypothetical protein